MDSQTKRTLAATALCLLLLFGWIKLQQMYNPPQVIEPSAETTTDTVVSSDNAATQATTGPSGATITAAPARLDFVAEAGDSTEALTLGDDRQDNKATGFTNPYKFGVIVTPVGGSIEFLRLSEQRAHVPKDHKNPDHAPYELLRPVQHPFSGEIYRSFVTERLHLVDEKKDIELGKLTWTARKESDSKGESAILSTTIKEGIDPILRITKVIRVDMGSPHLGIRYQIENLSKKDQKVRLVESGPTGFMPEDLRADFVRAVLAVVNADGRIRIGSQATRPEFKTDTRRNFTTDEGEHFLWSSISNKYFTCIVTPRPGSGSSTLYAPYLDQVYATTRVEGAEFKSDMTVVQVYAPQQPIAAGGRMDVHVSAYCGPKSDKVFAALPEAKAFRYDLTMAPDHSMCTFEFFNSAMLWLLTMIHKVFTNYGIAIIFLVIVVRAILHPVSRKGQINMMRMQKNMARIKPKLEAIQEQYKNDRQKLGEEQMKLYREEGVNPAASVLGCLPMMLQIPIWAALYSTLNTNVELRHAPFFGYIRDLSSPDALIQFDHPIVFPIVGFSFASINLLPIIMTAFMYGQQKLTQKLTKPDKPPAPKLDKDGNPLPDQMAQQQKIMNFMMIFMGFLFYNMPSGLCLYILCSSFLGMCEQMWIRKHIKEKEERGDFGPPQPAAPGGTPPKAGWLARKYEELQKIAEQQRLAQAKGQAPKRKKKRF